MHAEENLPMTKNHLSPQSLSRRAFIRLIAASSGAALVSPMAMSAALNEADESAPRLVRYPEKSDLILLTDRPPLLETPLHYFRQDLTPNEAFFVRWHLSGIPTTVDLRTFRLQIGGHVERPLSLSVAALRQQFEPVSLIAVNQCSGNSRSFYRPRVPGGQWQHGAMGNARWTGVRLRELLDKAGVKAGAVDVSFGALDGPPLSSTPDFAKSLTIDHARDGEVMIAYDMNGAPPPILNGFPLRLIVPGWYGTYWVKALNEINVLQEAFQDFWMQKAYRIPTTPNANESPDHLAAETVPINRFSLRSIFVRPEPDERLKAGAPFEVQGVALDSGYGIRRVEVSTDDGGTWRTARLDPELSKYSWRRWRFAWRPMARGHYRLKVRAFNAAGETQTSYQWNRGGYMRNVIEETRVEVI